MSFSLPRLSRSDTLTSISEYDLSETSPNITPTLIKKANDDLGKISLCWPKIHTPPEFEDRSDFPESYYQNSNKEKLTLLYAENFRRQYNHFYPDRKQLVLVAENECGLQKLVCTTIRPTCLALRELKNWSNCAQFVADFIDYEPLPRPTAAPERILGPCTVFKRQSGNSYEMAIALCSLLLGELYDAYVVSGHAIQDIAENIRIRTDCPVKPEELEDEEPEKPPTPVEQATPTESPKDSPEQASDEAPKDPETQETEDKYALIPELEQAPPDELYGWRTHAWVLLLPNDDDITEAIFVEPSTGVSYPTSTDVYTSVESVFNNVNYWANIQDYSNGIANMKYDLTDLSCWEHMLIGEPFENRKFFVDPEAEDDNPALEEKHLDMPASWVEKFTIPHDKIRIRYNNGFKSTNYRRTVLNEFGEYVQMDGLQSKIMHYADFECTELIMVEDVYRNRQDALVLTRGDTKKRTVTEYFKRGRPDACRTHTYDMDNNYVNGPRTMEFYYKVRKDGLEKLEVDTGFKKETYKNRFDKLYFRHIAFKEEEPDGTLEGPKKTIASITEKFQRNPSKIAIEDIAERQFKIMQNEIFLKFHTAPGFITANTRRFFKPKDGERLGIDTEWTSDYTADVDADPPSYLQLYYLYEAQLEAEQRSVFHLREIEDELSAFIRLRNVECAMPKLHVSIFNKERNESLRLEMLEQEEKDMEDDESSVHEGTDYLAPYIAKLTTELPLTKEKALLVRSECLKEFQQLMVYRANKLTQQFEAEYNDYQKKKLWFSENKSMLSFDVEDREISKLAQQKHKLQIYNMRLDRQQRVIKKRYANLEQFLATDKRLEVLYE
ncbi:lost boys [Carabus blaptoides fortunei]